MTEPTTPSTPKQATPSATPDFFPSDDEVLPPPAVATPGTAPASTSETVVPAATPVTPAAVSETPSPSPAPSPAPPPKSEPPRVEPPPGTALFLPPKKTTKPVSKPAGKPVAVPAPSARPSRLRTAFWIVLGLAALWSPWGYQWGTLRMSWWEFARILDPANARPLIPSILYGLKPTPKLKGTLLELVSTPFASSTATDTPKTVSLDRARKAAQAHPELNPGPDKQLDLFKRVSDGLAALPPTIPGPISPSALSPQLPAFDEIHDAARFWYVIARLQADRGNHRQAIWTLLGTALLGRLLDPVQITQMPFANLGRTVTADCRRIAAAGLIEIAPSLSLPREDLQAVLDLLGRLGEGLPIGTVAEQQIFFPFLVARAMSKEMANGIRFGSRLETIFRLFGDEERLKPYETILLNGWRQALSKPWSEMRRLVAVHEKVVVAWRDSLSSPGPRWLAWLFQPGKAQIELLLADLQAPFTRFLLQEYEGRQCLRGAGAVLAVLGFKRQHDRWPSGWAELEAWLGMKLPNDLYTSGPLGYSFANPPRIFSPGPDLATGTTDDLVFLPLPASR